MRNTHKPHVKVEGQDFYATLLNITTSKGNKVEMMVSSSGFARWESGELTQKCFPELAPEERELLISGMDYEEQLIMFAPPDLEEES